MAKYCARSQIFTQYLLTKICYTEKGEFSCAITVPGYASPPSPINFPLNYKILLNPSND